jgi:hypothetical protein
MRAVRLVFGVWELGLRDWGSGQWVHSLGNKGLDFEAEGLGAHGSLQGLWFRAAGVGAEGLGIGV